MLTAQIIPSESIMTDLLSRPFDDDLATAHTQACRAIQRAPAPQDKICEKLDWFFRAFQAANDSEDVQWSLCYGVMVWARGGK